MDENHNLLTLYDYLKHNTIPQNCHFLHLVNKHYQAYRAFYNALIQLNVKNIDEILYDSSIRHGMSLIISLKNDKADKFIRLFSEVFDDELDDNKFTLNISKLSESSLNVLITEHIEESEYYELRFARYRYHYKNQQLKASNESDFI